MDDEPDLLRLLERTLRLDLNCHIKTAASGVEALQFLKQESFDLVLADIKMPIMNGLELLALIKRDKPDQTVVMMTGYGSIENAVDAMKQGAYDFITKPFDHDALLIRLEKALERSSLLQENHRLRKACDREDAFKGFIGKSPAISRVFDAIRMVAGTDLTVLITGESGVGKGLTARAIHEISDRRQAPFVAVNCPTVPEPILESELFGYKKKAPSLTPPKIKSAYSRKRTAVRYFWTKSAISAHPFKPNCCAPFRKKKSSPWEIRGCIRWT